MKDFHTLEPALDPNNRISFLLDWELTMKCNLDCSYCEVGTYGGHDNSTAHPALADCLKSIDFMFEYADLYMSVKPQGIKYVILNIYGGESLHHPDIVEILSEIRNRYQPYKDRWHLTVTTTTNAIVSERRLQQIIPLIDEFTVSYHAENTDKQKQQFRDNVLLIQKQGKRQKCVVLMHQESEKFQDAQDMIRWLSEHSVKVLPRQLDGGVGVNGKQRIYNQEKIQWFDQFYKSQSSAVQSLLDDKTEANLSTVGRACCGGRQVCLDHDRSVKHFYVKNRFTDWYCSVNHFFLYVKQLTGEIFVNKDCKMTFEGSVGAIGNIKNSHTVIDTLRNQLSTKTLPVIQCKKDFCWCGVCAPKSQSLETYHQTMEKYLRI